VLWVDEDYHLAAGIQTLHGKMLYRDVWYDKPPLNAWVYAAIGGIWGWPLRLFDALYVLAICGVMYRFARNVWSEREGLFAAGLLAFFLNFDLAFAVVPIAPDLFMMLPHIAAVYLAWRGKPLAAGIACGVAFLFNTKALFIVPVCILLTWPGFPALVLGFTVPNVIAFAVLGAAGAFRDYLRQVWEWGVAYAKNSPVPNPAINALRRTVNWLGFHAAVVIAAAWFWRKEGRRTYFWIAVWTLLSLIAVAVGARFSPRYYFQLLPPIVLAAGRGLTLLIEQPRTRVRSTVFAAIVIAAAVPLVRFGPRYALIGRDLILGREHKWSDLILDQDSRAAADLVNARAHPGDTLIEWGYRPDVFVYTRLTVGSRYWDSQPLTGVPADRHLTGTDSIIPEWAAHNRRELTESKPTFIVDSLSVSNPLLAPGNYPELRAWLENYRLVGKTSLSLIYKRKTP